jgi:dipeptidyl aminopeptidase/acylaminoacyl peptidase
VLVRGGLLGIRVGAVVLACSLALAHPAPARRPGFTLEQIVATRNWGQFNLSPDGRGAVFTAVGRYFGHPLFPDFGEDNNLRWVSTASGELRQLTSGPFAKTYPRFSPDGRRVAFESEGDIWTVEVESVYESYQQPPDLFLQPVGGTPRQLTYSGQAVYRPENFDRLESVRAAISIFGLGEITGDPERSSPNYIWHLGGSEAQISEAYRRASPVNYVDQMQGPLLLLHSDGEPIEPVTKAYNFIQAMKKAGKAYQAQIYRNEAHGLRLLPHQLDSYQRILRFLEMHLKN